jgi:hypothetical protein
MKILLILVCSSLLMISITQSRQDGKALIETKTDRFSGITEITLKPLTLLKNEKQKLAASLKTKLDPQKPNESPVLVDFISYTEYPMSFGDMEVHCLIDGKPLRLGDAYRKGTALFPGSADTMSIGISLKELAQIANGNKVEMRLGPIEWTVSDHVLSVFRDFVKAAKDRLESFNKKGG